MCRVVVRLSKHPAVPPHDSVRSPGQMGFGEGPISARSPTEPLPKSVVSFDERPHRRNQMVQAGQEICISFQPSQCKFRQWSSLSGSARSREMYSAQASITTLRRSEKIAPEVGPLDASNSMRQAAASAISLGCPVSAHQSRKELLKPCGTS